MKTPDAVIALLVTLLVLVALCLLTGAQGTARFRVLVLAMVADLAGIIWLIFGPYAAAGVTLIALTFLRVTGRPSRRWSVNAKEDLERQPAERNSRSGS